MTGKTKSGWPEISEAATKATLKDDCFDMPEKGSAYHKQLLTLGDAVTAQVRARLEAEGLLKPKATPAK